MKTKLLRELKFKHQIRVQTIDVIKCLYSVTPLHHTKIYNSTDPEDAKWYSRNFDEAKAKQRELILKSARKYQAAIGKYFTTERWKNVSYCKYLILKITGYATRKNDN